MKRLYHLALVATQAVAIASPTLAAATRNAPGPTMGGADPIVTRSAGESTSPGDPFLPNQPNGNEPPKTYAPWEASCVNGGLSDVDKYWIGFQNTGNTTIPKGTVLLFESPYGTFKVKTVVDIEPGQVYPVVYMDKPSGTIECTIDFSPSPADYPPEGPR